MKKKKRKKEIEEIKKKEEIRSSSSSLLPLILVLAATLLYILIFGRLSILKYDSFNSDLDLAVMDQAVYNTTQGNFLEQFSYMGGEGSCRLGIHVDPILLGFVPFYSLWSDPRVLLFLQCLIAALGALPLFYLTRRRLNSPWAGLLLSLSYLLYPPLQYSTLFNFHAVVLATSFLLFTFYYLEIRAYKRYFLFMFLSLLCKEEISLIIFLLGLYIIIRNPKSFRLGLITSIIGLGWFYTCMWIIIPFFKGGPSIFYKRYTHLFGPFSKVITLIIANKIAGLIALILFFLFLVILLFFIRNLYQRHQKRVLISLTVLLIGGLIYASNSSFLLPRLKYLYQLLLPVAFFPLASPLTLFLAAPEFAVNMLSSSSHALVIWAYYTSGITPFIFISAIYGLKKISGYLKSYLPPLAFCLMLFAFSLYANHQDSPSPFSKNFRPDMFRVTPHHRLASSLIKSIPPGAAVSAECSLIPHLAHRRHLYLFPIIKEADYIILDKTSAYIGPLAGQSYRNNYDQMLNHLLASSKYKLTHDEDGLKLFEKSY